MGHKDKWIFLILRKVCLYLLIFLRRLLQLKKIGRFFLITPFITPVNTLVNINVVGEREAFPDYIFPLGESVFL